ncbi:MAG: hypothetical protein KAQ83_01455 [Nanoarchaeota archaeon]|nr:hypothetical protein [Nanoarchaeota archaeon]
MIEKILNQTRMPFSELDISQVKVEDPLDWNQVRGRLAERHVYEWLQRAGFQFYGNSPKQVGEYKLVQTNGGIVVYKSGQQIHEFDFLGELDGQKLIVEVKSLKLHGFSGKVDRALSIADKIYDAETGLLLFFPMYGTKVNSAKQLEEKYSRVRCVDIGFNKKQLKRMERKYYFQ